jgi:hypothetical protein
VQIFPQKLKIREFFGNFSGFFPGTYKIGKFSHIFSRELIKLGKKCKYFPKVKNPGNFQRIFPKEDFSGKKVQIFPQKLKIREFFGNFSGIFPKT